MKIDVRVITFSLLGVKYIFLALSKCWIWREDIYVVLHITKAELWNSFNRNDNGLGEAEDVRTAWK